MKIIVTITIALFAFQSLSADDVYLRDGSVFRNVKVVDTIGTNLRCITSKSVNYQLVPLSTIASIVFRQFDPATPSAFEDATSGRVTVKTVTGEQFVGIFQSADSVSITYVTPQGIRTINRNHVLSVERTLVSYSTSPHKESNPPGVVVNEYPNLWLMVPAVAGSIWSYSSFNSASDKRDARDAAVALGLYKIASDLDREISNHEVLGTVTALTSIILFIYAVLPQERIAESTLAISPSGNQIVVSVRL